MEQEAQEVFYDADADADAGIEHFPVPNGEIPVQDDGIPEEADAGIEHIPVPNGEIPVQDDGIPEEADANVASVGYCMGFFLYCQGASRRRVDNWRNRYAIVVAASAIVLEMLEEIAGYMQFDAVRRKLLMPASIVFASVEVVLALLDLWGNRKHPEYRVLSKHLKSAGTALLQLLLAVLHLILMYDFLGFLQTLCELYAWYRFRQVITIHREEDRENAAAEDAADV